MGLTDLIRGANRHIEQALEAELKPRGLSLHQYRVLEALAARNGQPMGDLAARLYVDGPTLTKIIDKMVAAAEVYRGPDPHDRRRVLVFLSRKGAAQFGHIGSLSTSIERDIFDRLGTPEAATLTRLLSELLAAPAPLHQPATRSDQTLRHDEMHASDRMA